MSETTNNPLNDFLNGTEPENDQRIQTGLLYMRARYYSPVLKRFLNCDIIDGSIADSTTLNLYAYVNGNPISFVDPFGLSKDRAYIDRYSIGNFSNSELQQMGDINPEYITRCASQLRR